MARNIVTVELIDNPAVRRDMTMASYELLKAGWRIVGEVKKEEPQKKSDVIPAEVREEPNLILESMRTNYETLTGKKAKGNWGTKRIQDELKKLQA